MLDAGVCRVGLAHSATYLLTLKTAQDARDFVFSFPVVLPPTACTFRPRNAFKNSAGRSRFFGGAFPRFLRRPRSQLGPEIGSARGPVIILFYRMGFGGQFRSTEYLFLRIWRFLPPFFGLALGGVGCASRAGRVAIGLERKVSPPTPRRKIGRLLNQMWGGASNPPPSAPNHNIRGHLLGGSLSRGPIVGGSLLRSPIFRAS